MQEVQIIEGAKVSVSDDGSQITVSGRLGSTSKTVNRRLLGLKIEGGKIAISEVRNRKLAKKAELAGQALASEIRSAMAGVEKGVEKKMRVVFAHFPMSIEIKGNAVLLKNVFGEKKPRVAKIVGTTKVEVKGQDLYVRGVDPYDVGQTATNINRLSFARRKDSRVFQDGVYYVAEE